MENNISIIIPWYNTDIELVERALLSVSNQTDIKDIDIVIYNDGSIVHKLVELKRCIKQFNIPINIVSNDDNKGISFARNKAVENCNGEWLIWLDADDELFPETVSFFRSCINDSKYDYFISKCIVIDKEKIEYREPMVYFTAYPRLKNTIQNPFISNIFSIQAQMIKKDVFLELGGFNSDFKYAEVTEFFLRYIWKKGTDKLKYIDEYLYRYYRNDGSHSTDRENLENQRELLLLKYANRFGLDVNKIEYKERDSLTGAQKYQVIQ